MRSAVVARLGESDGPVEEMTLLALTSCGVLGWKRMMSPTFFDVLNGVPDCRGH